MKQPYPLILRLVLALVVGVAAVAGCAAQNVAGPSGAQAAAPQAAAPEAAAPQSADYLIGPGDTLQVFVWGQPELSVTVPVRPDGRVTTPLVQDIEAVGKTPSQLSRDIEKVLSEFVRTPQVNVIVQGFVGTFGSQIRVLGQVAKPGAVPYRDKMTLLDAIIEVGGLTKFAAGNRARLVRTVDGRSEETRVRLDDLVNRGRVDKNVALRPGDVIIVPEAVF
jgi:polysaccharide export outer membrane protein